MWLYPVGIDLTEGSSLILKLKVSNFDIEIKCSELTILHTKGLTYNSYTKVLTYDSCTKVPTYNSCTKARGFSLFLILVLKGGRGADYIYFDKIKTGT